MVLTFAGALLFGWLADVPAFPDAGLQAAQFVGAPERVIVYPASGELRMLSGLQPEGDSMRAFDNEFRSQTYFSAFALSKQGGWGYATTTNSVAAARAIAMSECLSANSDCILIAEIVPRGYREPAPGDITLTPTIARMFLNPESGGAPPDLLRALAVSADGAYALVWGYPTQAETDANAVSSCSENINRERANVPDMPCILVPGLPGSD